MTAYLRSLGGVASRPDGRPRRWVRGETRAGEQIYTAACTGCHGARGEGGPGPALNNRVLLASATDSYLVETIRRGRRGTAMAGFAEPNPAWRTLASEEIEAVVAYLRTWEESKP